MVPRVDLEHGCSVNYCGCALDASFVTPTPWSGVEVQAGVQLISGWCSKYLLKSLSTIKCSLGLATGCTRRASAIHPVLCPHRGSALPCRQRYDRRKTTRASKRSTVRHPPRWPLDLAAGTGPDAGPVGAECRGRERGRLSVRADAVGRDARP